MSQHEELQATTKSKIQENKMNKQIWVMFDRVIWEECRALLQVYIIIRNLLRSV